MTPKITVLVVDDMPINVELLNTILTDNGYQVITAESGEQALYKMEKNDIDVVLLDIIMPGIDGFEVARRIRKNVDTALTPIILVTGSQEKKDRIAGIEVGCDDFITKPFDQYELLARVKSLAKVKAYNDHMKHYKQELEKEVKSRTKELNSALTLLKNASLELIERLAVAAEYKDEDTGEHIHRLGYYAAVIAKKMGLDDAFIQDIQYAAPLHDVGKIGIPDKILLKEGPLTDEEKKVMRKHTTIGYGILKDSDQKIIQMAESVAISHHERWDGKGYPNQIMGKDIPIEGRIIAVADVFDALISRRPYKKPMPIEQAIAIITEERGKQFDPQVVDAFLSAEDEILSIVEKKVTYA